MMITFLEEPHLVEVEIKNDTDGIEHGQIPCMRPEDILAHLIGKCGLKISDRLCERYWSHLESVQDEVAVTSRDYRRAAGEAVWPIGLHGDEASMGLISGPYEKIVGVWLNLPLFRPKSSRMSRYLLFSVESHRIVDFPRTLNPVISYIVDSLNRCTEAGVLGRRFIVSEIRGDQAWIRSLFQHKSRWTAVSVCFRCRADTRSGPLNYASYDGWIPTRRTTRQFLMDELPQEMSHSVA